MSKDILLEIGMEEIPARFIRSAVEQLKDKMAVWLHDARIGYTEIQAYATPRRIAVLVSSVEEKQADLKEEIKGPSKKIALSEEGEWSKAALGFARSQGVDTSDLFFQELSGVEYVYAVKSNIGVETASVLKEGLVPIITSMNFPKNMRWGKEELKYVRPIRWMVCLFGKEIIPINIANVSSNRITKGHRFLGQETAISHPRNYVQALKDQFVIADFHERKQMILDQLEQLSQKQGWKIAIPEELLEEVLFLVEYPTVLFGSFSEDFLRIPHEALITSMREHQRYFPVFDDQENLLPFFVTVRNGNDVSLEQVAKGNEKVLRARLSDAAFFYKEDQQLSIDSALAKLESIVFLEELGTTGDKVRRNQKIAQQLAAFLSIPPTEAEDIKRAAKISKFDLVTQMVYEFPELQGVMGEDYALKAGEKETVARAIFEHYQPRFSGDASPKSLVGAIVSIADKMDTIVGCFSIGIIPTGSQDPYALRRQAAGIVQILKDHNLEIKLSDLFEIALNVHAQAGHIKQTKDEIMSNLMDFFALRVKNVLSENNVRYDVVDAVMGSTKGFEQISSTIRRAAALMKQVVLDDFKTTLESFNRANNLATKAKQQKITTTLFEQQTEHDLYEAWQKVHEQYIQALGKQQEDKALALLAQLKQPITAYFDSVMVMAKEEEIKQNRLALLAIISNDFMQFADFQKIVL